MSDLTRTELTVLRATSEALGAGGRLTLERLTELTGLELGEVQEALVQLNDQGLVKVLGSTGHPVVRINSVTPAGRRLLREMPAASDSSPLQDQPPGVVPETWTAVEGPVLIATARRMTAAPRQWVEWAAIADELGLTDDQVSDAFRALHQDGLFERTETDITGHVDVFGLTPAGRRKVGRWPSDGPTTQAALVEALDRIAAAIEDPDERNAAEKVRDGVANLSGQSLVSTIGAVAGAFASGLAGAG